jgi:acetyltransferase-like isoleucine patch superfamily enzyme
MKSINTTTIIKTDVPPTDIVGDIPAKLIRANGSKHIKC